MALVSVSFLFIAQVVDFLPPFLIHHLRAYMSPQKKGGMFHFLHPFNLHLWLFILLAIAVFAIVKFVLTKLSVSMAETKKENLSKLRSE